MRGNLKERAYEHLWDKMASGDIAPGSHLSDVHLAKEIGISRTPVREAILMLETQGLVEQISGVGPQVKRLDRAELQEAFEFRDILEVAAAVRAAHQITDAELAELSALCNQYRQLAHQIRHEQVQEILHPLGSRMVVLDMAFHLKLIHCARNRRLLRTLSDLHVLGRILRLRSEIPATTLLSRIALAYRDHRRILRALQNRDPNAAEHWMSRHIRRARQHHLDAFDWHESQAEKHIGDGVLPPHVQRLLARMESGVGADGTGIGLDRRGEKKAVSLKPSRRTAAPKA